MRESEEMAMSELESVDRLMTEDRSRETDAPKGVLGVTIGGWLRRETEAAIQLDSCNPFEPIVVKTCGSVYELIVLSGRTGEVMVRGGRFFPEFHPAILTGSRSAGSALKLRSLEVGLSMEFQTDSQFVITSAVAELSRADCVRTMATTPW
jgi:hypothetical protein